MKARKEEMEKDLLVLVDAICQHEPGSTNERIVIEALRERAEPWRKMRGKAPCR